MVYIPGSRNKSGSRGGASSVGERLGSAVAGDGEYYGTNPQTGKPYTSLADARAQNQESLSDQQYGMFEGMFEFPAIEALPPIEVNAITAELAGINRGTFKVNTGLADTAARTTTAGIFDDFQNWLEEILPGQGELVRSSAATVQEFIDTGLPRAVQNNAMARDAAALAAGGVRGTIGANRLLYNEAQRDIAGIQYGIGAAQQMVAQAQSVAGQFAGIQANLGSNYLNQLNQLTTITPAQGVGFAFDERAYQTGVDQFNATGMFNAATASASFGLQAASLDMQRQQFAAQLEAQRQAEKSSRFGALGSLIGAGAGALLALPTGGMSLALGAGIGSQIGGGLGQMAGGNYAGGTSSLLGGLGTYGGYQMQMDQYGLQQRQMSLMERSYGYQPGLSSAPWAPRTMSGYGGGMTTFGEYGYGYR